MSVKTCLSNGTLLRLTTDKKMENLSVICVGLYMPCRLCDDSLLTHLLLGNVAVILKL